MDSKTIVIAVLIAAGGILGFLYWDSRENVLIKVPGVEIKRGEFPCAGRCTAPLPAKREPCRKREARLAHLCAASMRRGANANLVTVDLLDRIELQIVVLAIARRIFCELDALALDAINLPDHAAAAVDDVHMLTDFAGIDHGVTFRVVIEG
jgi:hypothetical protein